MNIVLHQGQIFANLLLSRLSLFIIKASYQQIRVLRVHLLLCVENLKLG